MKNLNEFLRNIRNTIGLDLYIDLYEGYEAMSEYFNDDIDQKYIEKIIKDKSIPNYISENLKSHDCDKLIDVINKFHNEEIESYDIFNFSEDSKLKALDIICKNNYICEKLISDKNFKNILNFFNYYVTKCSNNIISIEPLFPKNMNNYVYGDNENQCHGILYHFCSKDTAEKILKSGLRIKKSKTSKREYPARIYMLASPNLNIRKQRIKVIQFAKCIIGNDVNINDYCILKVNMRGFEHNIDFYKDESMANDECVFCYSNIPASRIEHIDIANYF